MSLSSVRYQTLSQADLGDAAENQICYLCQEELNTTDATTGSTMEIMAHTTTSGQLAHPVHRQCLAEQAEINIQFLKEHPDYQDFEVSSRELGYSVHCGLCRRKISNLYSSLPMATWRDRVHIATLHHPHIMRYIEGTASVFSRTAWAGIDAGVALAIFHAPSNPAAIIAHGLGGALLGTGAAIEFAPLVRSLGDLNHAMGWKIQNGHFVMRPSDSPLLRNPLPATRDYIITPLLSLVPALILTLGVSALGTKLIELNSSDFSSANEVSTRVFVCAMGFLLATELWHQFRDYDLRSITPTEMGAFLGFAIVSILLAMDALPVPSWETPK